MVLNDNEINEILKKYDRYIIKSVHNNLPKEPRSPFSIPREEIVQEVRIKLWKLLKDKYNSDIGEVEPFVIGHVPMIIKSVMRGVKTSLHVTGNVEKGGKRNRTQFSKLKNKTVFIDGSDHIDLLGYILKQEDTDSYFIDEEVIIKEAKKRLGENAFEIFELLFIRDYTRAEISRKIDKCPSAITWQVNNNILPALKQILIDLDYIN